MILVKNMSFWIVNGFWITSCAAVTVTFYNESMKDPTDSSTADLIPEPKKRGPKPTGKAMTPTERKQQQRKRDRELLHRADLEVERRPVTVTGLIEAISRAAAAGDADQVETIAQQLADRIRERNTEQTKQADRVTVADPGTSENP